MAAMEVVDLQMKEARQGIGMLIYVDENLNLNVGCLRLGVKYLNEQMLMKSDQY